MITKQSSRTARAKTVPDPGAKKVPELTSGERNAINRFLARRAEKPSVTIKVSKGEGGAMKIKADGPRHQPIGDWLLRDALATADEDFYNGILQQLIDTGSHGPQVDEAGLNFMLSVIKGVEPKDQLETMLAAQMAAVHMASMTFARRLARVENIPQQDSAERAFNKLTRTFVAQMEALKRYRTGGEQKVTVQHVSVSEGGRAIVGNVTQAARQKAPESAASPPALTDANAAPMPIIDAPTERSRTAVRRRASK